MYTTAVYVISDITGGRGQMERRVGPGHLDTGHGTANVIFFSENYPTTPNSRQISSNEG
jgi:hypothetical protein